MAITALEIENFKSFAQRQRLELRPFTLLFGPNSAGKSSLLQSLDFLQQLLRGGDAERIALDGVARLTHGHDVDAKISIRVEFEVLGSIDVPSPRPEEFPFVDLDDETTSAWLELSVGQGSEGARRVPRIESAKIGINGEPIPAIWLNLEANAGPDSPILARVNVTHGLFADVDPQDLSSWEYFATPESSDADRDVRPNDAPPEVWLPEFLLARTSFGALPDLERPLQLLGPSGASVDLMARAHVLHLLELMIQGVCRQLTVILNRQIHIGPLRTVPSEAHLLGVRPSRAAWFDGKTAWDSLLDSDDPEVLDLTNKWLAKLGTGVKVSVQQLRDPRAPKIADINDPAWGGKRLILRAGTIRLLPTEVGSGVSQVVPVIVASQISNSRFVAVEQPELHVHPALQVGLADLFLDGATRSGSRKRFIIETHSEHLILRLLKRIREGKNLVPDDLCVVYIEPTKSGAQIRRLRVDSSGEFVDVWPAGFFEERVKEIL